MEDKEEICKREIKRSWKKLRWITWQKEENSESNGRAHAKENTQGSLIDQRLPTHNIVQNVSNLRLKLE